MKTLYILGSIATLIILIALLIAAWPMLPAFALVTLTIGIGLATGAGLIGLFYLYAQADHRRAQAQRERAEAEATLLNAAKIHADNSAVFVVPGRGVAQLAPPPIGAYGTITNLHTWHATQAQPVGVGGVEVIKPDQLPATAEGSSTTFSMPTANFFDYVPANPFKELELYLTLGVSATGHPITRPITELTHFLPAGKTKSGKSTFLRVLAAQALIGELSRPNRALVALIDLSGITFNPDLFDRLPQVYGGRVVQDERAAIELIAELIGECQRRARLYSQAPGLPESLPEYNAVVRPEQRLPVVLTFIEEMSALAEFAGREFLSPLKRLMWQARKFGIYLANAGQDFRANVIDKSITDNSSSRFLFGGVDDTTARVIGFDPKRHRISEDKPGRGLVMLNKEVQEFQGLFLEKTDFVNLINGLRTANGLTEVGWGQPQPEQHTSNRGQGQTDSGRGAKQPSPPGNVVMGTWRELTAAPDEIETARRAVRTGAKSVSDLEKALKVSRRQAYKFYLQLREEGLI